MAQVLRRTHTSPDHPDVVVGLDAPDDAGVYRITEDVAIIQTVDFFTPIVDDPFDFGRIAAANAISDIYAMGGIPRTALQLISWPRDDLPFELLGQIIEGGMAVLDEAECVLIGGHSIDDKEPKYGFAITGTAHPDDVITVGGGKPGDVLVLTKSLGVGIIATAIKGGHASEDETAAAVASMVELNRAAGTAMMSIGVEAATDVTGFGLLGHLMDLTSGAEITMAAVPILDGVRAHVEAGRVPGGTRRNLAAVTDRVDWGEVDEVDQIILADAQTNGGLLMAVAPEKEAQLVDALGDAGVAGIAIGHITGSDRIRIR
ncbi:MAG: selenide, water dikinase SelD [Acidimicrobiia bacterium]|nr:selenide, water dikinase SelD [Acidimicrobiia bacterium]